MIIQLETASHILREYLKVFTTFSDEEWHELAKTMVVKEVKKKQEFVRFGEVAESVGFVLNGSLRQYYITPANDEHTTYFFFEGSLVGGYLSFVAKKPSLITIEAMETAQILTFPYSALERLYDRYPAWERFGRRIAEYLVMGLEERLVEHLMYSPEERYERLVKSHRTKILERAPQQYIASYLGITPVSLSRIRARFGG